MFSLLSSLFILQPFFFFLPYAQIPEYFKYKFLSQIKEVLLTLCLSLGKLVLIYTDLFLLWAFNPHSIKCWWLLFRRQLYEIKYYKYSAFLSKHCNQQLGIQFSRTDFAQREPGMFLNGLVKETKNSFIWIGDL